MDKTSELSRRSEDSIVVKAPEKPALAIEALQVVSAGHQNTLDTSSRGDRHPTRGRCQLALASGGAALHQPRCVSKDTTNITEFRTPGTRCVAIPSETFGTLEYSRELR